jgi:hypothetical protein
VRQFKNTLFLLAAILWLPMSAHCQLERIPALKFLACGSDADSAGKDSDCSDMGCCPVEKSQYRANQNRVAIPSLDLLPLIVEFTDVATELPAKVSAATFGAIPPELPKCWQFVFRTASPPRAPSFAS